MTKKYNKKNLDKNLDNSKVKSKSESKPNQSKQLNPVDVYVGSRVKERRVSLNLSQNYIAKQLGITFQQIQKYEKGSNRIGSSRLYELSKLLEVHVSYFFENYESLSEKTLNTSNAEEQSKKDSLHRDIQKAIKLFESTESHMVRENMINTLKSILKSNIELEKFNNLKKFENSNNVKEIKSTDIVKQVNKNKKEEKK